MTNGIINHILFEHMRAEHRQIEQRLELLDDTTNFIELKKTAEWLWEFSELKHHFKEETILFPAIVNHPRITEGGPMCGLYFDFHMLNNPVTTVQKIIPLLSFEEHQKLFYSRGSPLTIPIDEHRCGKSLLKFVLDQWNMMEPGKIATLLKLYQEIQISHIRKEETCLFFLCANLLTAEQADQLFEDWKNFS